jgi:triacylglycerol esterase/lipase EstA (alpha/beta hydrolase family)
MDVARIPLLGGLAPRRRLLVASVLLIVVVLLGALLYAGQNRTARPSGRPDQARPGPVLLVPGYGGGQGGLSVLADRIRQAGRSAQVVTLPGDGMGDLVAQAAALDGEVSRALRQGAQSVDLVGYSAGGVVVRLWVARFGGGHAARRVVTLGSPLHGTTLAGVGSALVPAACPIACQQLVPGSSLLDQLDGASLPAGLPWLSVWTQDDQTVTPPDSARLSGAVNVAAQTVCAGAQLGHSQLPTDPLVTGLVLRAIGTDPLRAPAATDCAALRARGSGH